MIRVVTVLKYVNLKRLFLNIGFLCLFTSALFGIRHLHESSFIKQVTGTVVYADRSEYSYYGIRPDGSQYTIPRYRYGIMYTTLENQKYTDTVYGMENDYKLNQQFDVLYDIRNPEHIEFYPVNHSFEIIVFFVVGTILIAIFRKEFNGYINDFVRRYPKSFAFTVISLPVPAIYYYTRYLHPSFAMYFRGLSEAVTLILLMAAVPLANAAVWVISVTIYCRRQQRDKTKNGKNKRKRIKLLIGKAASFLPGENFPHSNE